MVYLKSHRGSLASTALGLWKASANMNILRCGVDSIQCFTVKFNSILLIWRQILCGSLWCQSEPGFVQGQTSNLTLIHQVTPGDKLCWEKPTPCVFGGNISSSFENGWLPTHTNLSGNRLIFSTENCGIPWEGSSVSANTHVENMCLCLWKFTIEWFSVFDLKISLDASHRGP